MDFYMFLFFDIMFFTLGFVIGRWFHARDVASEIATRGLCKTEHEQPMPEPGTFGKRTNYSAIHVCDQVDAFLASCPIQAQLDAGIEALLAARPTEEQLEADIEEMQRRGW
jgi:hypothetical protein